MTLISPSFHRLLNCGTFLVSDKPVVLAKQEVKYGYLNGTVELVCQVLAEPPPKFHWSKKLKRGKEDLSDKVESDTYSSIAKVIDT